jgi:hypothetical protein
MILTFLAAAAVAAGSPAEAQEARFEPSAERFADAATCRARLEAVVAAARGYEAVRGPYEIAPGDVRIHMVRAEGPGHRIWEHRCLGAALSARSWQHSIEQAEEPFTVDSAARKAEWLKKDGPEQ